MHVVALLSGGKDSCYTLLKCIAHGHAVVALAHITPPTDEPDSFMFQSVGSNAVPALAEALDLPLFTRPTHAKAAVTQLAYAPHPDDEVEDLVQLLRDVKQALPQVDAVCAGALWSDYQRLRVESAAARVGMLSLAYLWRRNQRELLAEMIAAGVDAILVKVAGIGLKPEHLGKSLKEMQPHLHKLEELYGSHVCGEGGEYETLVLSMPMFKKKLVLDKVQVVVHEESDIAPVAYLQIQKFHLENLVAKVDLDLPVIVPCAPEPLRPYHPNSIISDLFLRDASCHESKTQEHDLTVQQSVQPLTHFTVTQEYAHVVTLSNLCGAEGVSGAASALQEKLKEEGFSLGDVLYVWLNLETVKGQSYAQANRAYCSVFGVSECIPPPSRACIAMPNGSHPVSIEAIARRNRRAVDSDSRTLHVQSLSEWAPPCIGPYAQVVEDRGITFVSGALAMHAPNASIENGAGVRAQTRGCLFNIERTLHATRTKFDELVFFVAYTVAPEFFLPIREIFFEHVQDHVVLAVVPCIGLPKDALVEIRAVGSHCDAPDTRVVLSSHRPCQEIAEDALGKQDISRVAWVRHGQLMSAHIFISSRSDSSSDICKRFLNELNTLKKDHDCSILSSQVYVLQSEADDIEACIFSNLGKNLNLIRSRWIPGRPRILGVITLDCS